MCELGWALPSVPVSRPLGGGPGPGAPRSHMAPADGRSWQSPWPAGHSGPHGEPHLPPSRATQRPETLRGSGQAVGRRALGSIPAQLSHDAPIIRALLLGTPTPHSCRDQPAAPAPARPRTEHVSGQQQPENLENVSDAWSSGKKWGVRVRRREVGTRSWVAAMGGQGLPGRAGESGGAAVPIRQPLLSSSGSSKAFDPGLVRVPALGPEWHPQPARGQSGGVQDVMSRWGGASWDAMGWDPRPLPATIAWASSCLALGLLGPGPSSLGPHWAPLGGGARCCLVGLVPGNALEPQLSQPLG